MDLIEIGTALREGRESKGLTIEAVEEKTKIAPSVIAALEEGNSSRFPHPVYARGFVRSYALLLGLDAQELCAHFSREYPVPKDTDQPKIPTPQIRVKMHDSGHVVTAVRIFAILGILLLGALGWYAFDHYRSLPPTVSAPVEEHASPAPSAPSSVPPAEALPSEAMPAPMTQMQEVAATPDAQAEADSALNASSDDAATQNASAVSEATDNLGETPVAEPAQGDAHSRSAQEQVVTEAAPAQAVDVPAGARSMRIVAHSASWLQARPDDKVLDYFLRKGETATVTFSKSLSIKFGNAGGVKLELDGKPYHFDGTLGEVKTLVVE